MVETFRFLRKCIKVAAFPAHDGKKMVNFQIEKQIFILTIEY